MEAKKTSQTPTMERIMERKGGLDEVHTKYVDFILRFWAVAVFIAVPISVSRASLTGWLPIYNIHIVIGIALVVVAFMRSRISLEVKKAFICALLFIIGTTGLFTYGLISGGIVFLAFFNISVGLLYRPRIFLLSGGITTLVYLVAAWGFVSGQLIFPVEAGLYASNPFVWATLIVASVPFILGFFYAFSTFTLENQRLATQLRAVVETEPECVMMLAADGSLLEINQAGLDMIDADSISQVKDMPLQEMVSPAYRNDCMALQKQVFEGNSGKLEFEICSLKGVNRWLETHAVPLRNSEGKISCLLSVTRDITERKRAEEEMRIAAVTFQTHDAILITDANANIIRVNQAFQLMTGYSTEEVMGKNPRILSSGRHSKEFYADMWQHLKDNDTWSGEVWDKRKNGQIYPKWQTITSVKDDKGKVTEYVAIASDITSRKQAEEEIHHLAFYDSLTGLPNRRLLMENLRSALSVSARSHHYGALLFLDIDRFKILNDTLGHDYGDLMLIEVARRIQSSVRGEDTVARLGGDEFVVLIVAIGESAENASRKAALIAEKIRASLSTPYQLKSNLHHSSPSIGVCLYRGNAESADVLLKHADMAMYQAKDSGRNAVRFFDPAMQLAVETRAVLEADLRHAVPERQLHLHYQIQVDSHHRPVGAEALVRWIHPERGTVSPMQFIPIAEDSSLILDIGGWVLETACSQLAVWAKSERSKNLTLAVNVSAKQFKQPGFVAQVAAVLQAHQVEASRLKLELTESVVLNDVSDVVSKMRALNVLGVRLSMDDFGTGYSSLSYLKQLPLDQIKIDQSFIRDIATDQNDAMMVKTIIDMAQNFQLDVIAEGVESEAQLEFLRQNGCMAYQGYFFGKPVPIEELELLLPDAGDFSP